MEAQWICDRAALRTLLRQSPQWSNAQYAQALGRSVSWVKKWKKRLRLAPAEDMEVLLSRSRAHHSPYPRWHPQVLQGSKLDVRYLTHWAHTLGVEKLLEQALHDAGLR